MNKLLNIKRNYSKDEILNYCIDRKKFLLNSSEQLNKRIIDELFALERIITINSTKNFNFFEIQIYSSVNITKEICDNEKLCDYFNDKNYEKQFKNIIKYLVVRYNINSENNFYELESIKSSFFIIKDIHTNTEFNIRRLFPKHKMLFNGDGNYIRFLMETKYDENNLDTINRDIVRLSDYFNRYGSFQSFSDIRFFEQVDLYSKEINKYNLTFQNDLSLLLNKLPINLYDQNDINLYFKNKSIEIVINDIFFYQKFVFKLYGRKDSNNVYQSVDEFNYSNFNEFLLIANTKKGVAIYESSKGLQFFDNVIVDKESDIILEKNKIYLKSKKDYFSINLMDAYFNNDYSIYLIDNNYNFIRRPSLAQMEQKENTDIISFINGKKYYIFYISNDNSLKGDVLKYILNLLEFVEIEQNIFSDDSSINYKIYVPENDIEILIVLDYLRKSLAPFKIYNISVIDLYHFMLKDDYFYDNIVSIYKKSVEKHDDIKNNYLYKLQHVCNLIIQEIQTKYNLTYTNVIDFLNDNYINRDLLSHKFLNDYFRKLMNEKNEDYIQLKAREDYGKTPGYYDKYVRKLGTNRQQWKSEKLLFDIVRNIYPDTIYQYKTAWLGKFSLDIFIPSIKTAIEYQGIQHYKKVDYFSDNEHFMKQQENDKLKKKLCEENSIKLIEWIYNDPISDIYVKEKLGLICAERKDNMDLEIENFKILNENKDFKLKNLINEYNNLVVEMTKLLNYLKNIQKINNKKFDNCALLTFETALYNHNYNLNLAKELQPKLELQPKYVYQYVKLLKEKVVLLKKDLDFFEKLLSTNETNEFSQEYEKISKPNYSIRQDSKTKKSNNNEIFNKVKNEKSGGLLSTIFGLFFGLSNNKNTKDEKVDYLMPLEQEEVKKGNYNSWNFEEEELEEDDYYNDDLD